MTSNESGSCSSGRDAEEVIFNSLKEHRRDYFVEYCPPRAGNSFATINLVFLKQTSVEKVAAAMETELHTWMVRYNVPTMVSGFDDTGSVIALTGARSGNHLVGWSGGEQGNLNQSWKRTDLDSYLKAHPLTTNLRLIYSDIPFRTKKEVGQTSAKRIAEMRIQNRNLRLVLIVWLGGVPLIAATLQYLAPAWVSLVIYLYSFFKAYQTWRKITGRAKPSKRNIEKAEKERKMRHYYYHCERNPAGFSRLKLENFDEDERVAIRREASEIV